MQATRQALRSCAQQLLHSMTISLREPNMQMRSRSMFCLERLLALARLQNARRLSMFCAELHKLLQCEDATSPWGAHTQTVVAQACVRIMQSVHTSAMLVEDALLDPSTMNALRVARGVAELAIDYAVPAQPRLLPAAFVQALRRRTGETLRERELASAQGIECWQLPRAPRAAVFWPGVIEVTDPAAQLQQLLWLHWQCEGVLEGSVPEFQGQEDYLGAKNLSDSFLLLASHALLRALLMRCRRLAESANRNSAMFIDATVRELSYAQFSLCFVTEKGSHGILDSMYRIAEVLALHLQCWRDFPGQSDTELVYCLLCLSGALDEWAKPSAQHKVLQAYRRSLHSRVSRYLVKRQRLLRSEIAVQIQTNLYPTFATQVVLLSGVLLQFIERHETKVLSVIEDEVFMSLSQLASACLCVGELVLYEMLDSIRSLFSLSIESQISFPAPLLASLSQVLQLLQISTQRPHPPALLRSVQETFFAARRRILCASGLGRQAIEMVSSRGKKGASLRVHAAKLPVYLATNIHALIVAPEQLALCAATPERFHRLARQCLLELGMLASGARALHVFRVAELSEALAQVHRSLAANQHIPEQAALDLLTQAHLILRQSLNRAAARQSVPDVRDIIARLYRWLELQSKAQGSAESPEQRQHSLALARALNSGLQSLEDAMRLLPANAGQGLALAQDILKEQRHYLKQLEEEIEASGFVSLARWRGPLLRLVARVANKADKHVRMLVENDNVRIDRNLAAALLPMLEQVLTRVIHHSIESPLARREGGKPQTAWVRLQAKQAGDTLLLQVEEDGEGLPDAELKEMNTRLQAFGASLREVRNRPEMRCLQVSVALQSARWDIVPKPL